MPATITAIINQKGGTGKTCTCASLGIGLAREGKNVLLVDFDPQSSLTISLGYDKPDDLPVTVATLMMKAMNGKRLQLAKVASQMFSQLMEVDITKALHGDRYT